MFVVAKSNEDIIFLRSNILKLIGVSIHEAKDIELLTLQMIACLHSKQFVLLFTDEPLKVTENIFVQSRARSLMTVIFLRDAYSRTSQDLANFVKMTSRFLSMESGRV